MTAVMPGRAVDIVCAAVVGAGEGVGSMNLDLNWRGDLTLMLHLRVPERPRDEIYAGRLVFARLGVTDATLGPVFGRPGVPIANLTAVVPVLGGARLDIVVRVPGPDPDAGDVAALVAQVDAARAAEAERDRCGTAIGGPR